VLAGYGERVARFKPDAVVVMLGTNDATLGFAGLETYRSTLACIVGRVMEEEAHAVVLTPPAVSRDAVTRTPFIAAYAQAARDVATARKATLVDIFADWMDRGDGSAPIAWMSDAIHPNAHGHREIARLLIEHVETLHVFA
jgi:lysophospholipase L1-like esterase